MMFAIIIVFFLSLISVYQFFAWLTSDEVVEISKAGLFVRCCATIVSMFSQHSTFKATSFIATAVVGLLLLTGCTHQINDSRLMSAEARLNGYEGVTSVDIEYDIQPFKRLNSAAIEFVEWGAIESNAEVLVELAELYEDLDVSLNLEVSFADEENVTFRYEGNLLDVSDFESDLTYAAELFGVVGAVSSYPVLDLRRQRYEDQVSVEVKHLGDLSEPFGKQAAVLYDAVQPFVVDDSSHWDYSVQVASVNNAFTPHYSVGFTADSPDYSAMLSQVGEFTDTEWVAAGGGDFRLTVAAETGGVQLKFYGSEFSDVPNNEIGDRFEGSATQEVLYATAGLLRDSLPDAKDVTYHYAASYTGTQYEAVVPEGE